MAYRVIITRDVRLDVEDRDMTGNERENLYTFKNEQGVSGVTAYRYVGLSNPATFMNSSTARTKSFHFGDPGFSILGLIIVESFPEKKGFYKNITNLAVNLLSGSTSGDALATGATSHLLYDNRIVDVPTGGSYGFHMQFEWTDTGGTAYTGATDLYVANAVRQNAYDFISTLQTNADAALTGLTNDVGVSFSVSESQAIKFQVTGNSSYTGCTSIVIKAPTNTGATDFRFQLFGSTGVTSDNMIASSLTATTFEGRMVTYIKPNDIYLVTTHDSAYRPFQVNLTAIGQR